MRTLLFLALILDTARKHLQNVTKITLLFLANTKFYNSTAVFLPVHRVFSPLQLPFERHLRTLEPLKTKPTSQLNWISWGNVVLFPTELPLTGACSAPQSRAIETETQRLLSTDKTYRRSFPPHQLQMKTSHLLLPSSHSTSQQHREALPFPYSKLFQLNNQAGDCSAAQLQSFNAKNITTTFMLTCTYSCLSTPTTIGKAPSGA